jgi:hypothetical protein
VLGDFFLRSQLHLMDDLVVGHLHLSEVSCHNYLMKISFFLGMAMIDEYTPFAKAAKEMANMRAKSTIVCLA